MNSPPVSKLKNEIAVLEGIIWEKKEQLRIAEAIEKQKDDLWRKHVVVTSQLVVNNIKHKNNVVPKA